MFAHFLFDPVDKGEGGGPRQIQSEVTFKAEAGKVRYNE